MILKFMGKGFFCIVLDYDNLDYLIILDEKIMCLIGFELYFFNIGVVKGVKDLLVMNGKYVYMGDISYKNNF